MNKKGHIAIAATCGSAALSFLPIHGLIPSASMIALAVLGGLAPDLDHKTSTASNHIQLSLRNRVILKRLSILLIAIGVVLLVSQYLWGNPTPQLEVIFKSSPLWMGAGVFCWALTKLRVFALIGAGVLLLIAFKQYNLHWMVFFCGIVLVILPTLKHRGLIHTPEFATALTVGLLSLASEHGGSFQLISLGFLIGWWSHLAADCFGKEGIHFFIFPKCRFRLNLFANGGIVENLIAVTCWIGTVLIWINLLTHVKIFVK